MSVQVTPHPAWVAELDATLEPQREAILDTPVIIHASENALIDGKIQDFLVAFIPSFATFPSGCRRCSTVHRKTARRSSGTTSGSSAGTTPCGARWEMASMFLGCASRPRSP